MASKLLKDDYCKELDTRTGVVVGPGKPGWQRVDVPRLSSEKAMDPYWFHPDGWRFRSKKEVERWLEGGSNPDELPNSAFLGDDGRARHLGLGISKAEAIAQGLLSSSAATPASAGKKRAADAASSGGPKSAAGGGGASAKEEGAKSAQREKDSAAGAAAPPAKKAAVAVQKDGVAAQRRVKGSSSSSGAAGGGGGGGHVVRSDEDDSSDSDSSSSDDSTAEKIRRTAPPRYAQHYKLPEGSQRVIQLCQKKLPLGYVAVTDIVGFLGSDPEAAFAHFPDQVCVFQRTVYEAVREFGVDHFFATLNRPPMPSPNDARIRDISPPAYAVLARVVRMDDEGNLLDDAAPKGEPPASEGNSSTASGGSKKEGGRTSSVSSVTDMLNTLAAKQRVGFCQTTDNNCQLYIIPPGGGQTQEFLSWMLGCLAPGASAPAPKEAAYLLMVVRDVTMDNLVDCPPVGDPSAPAVPGERFGSDWVPHGMCMPLAEWRHMRNM